uniref:Coagulation factor X n=1 Tax=Cyprinus carpio TaxID=7962 RepID=A0A8C2G7P1_CYPCA
ASWDALSLISRQKRSNAGDEETKLPASLERECLEEVCDYEEAREVFQDNYRTDIFWSVYIDGDQCAEQPCKNGAMCSDSVGGFDCICKSGFSGINCETGKRVTSFEAGEQTLQVKQVHIHPLYAEGKPDNDMAVVELTQKMVFKKSVLPACLPERDFADNVLMAGDYMGVVTGWKEASGATDLEGNLMLNHLSYDKLLVCSQRHSGQVTNKMACTLPRAKADCILGHGSPVLTLYREVFFLTGIVSQPPGTDCKNGYVLQKVSRFLPWLNTFMRP